MARGNQAADQPARRAALQNNDLIGVATIVPQANLPKTPLYTEGETLKAKSEGFQDHMGVVPKGGTPFSAWEPPMKVVNSLHLGEKALQRLLERPFGGTGLQMTIRQVFSSCST